MYEPDDDDLGTVRWFGDSWQAPVCDPRTHVDTPTGLFCTECGKPIDGDDQGVTLDLLPGAGVPWTRAPWHLRCWLAQVLGPNARDLLTHNPEVKR